jgi:hypothetical protein
MAGIADIPSAYGRRTKLDLIDGAANTTKRPITASIASVGNVAGAGWPIAGAGWQTAEENFRGIPSIAAPPVSAPVPDTTAAVEPIQGNVAGAGWQKAGADFPTAGAGWKTADENFRGVPSIAGLASSGSVRLHKTGLIAGQPNPALADDVTINAKKGEYVLDQDVVNALGGPQALDKMVLSIKKELGLPAEVGPKTHNMPDSMGRMDKPGLPSIAGMADAGAVYAPNWREKPVAAFTEDPATSIYEQGSNQQSVGQRLAGGVSAIGRGIQNMTGGNIDFGLKDEPGQASPLPTTTPQPVAEIASPQPYTPALVPENLREKQSVAGAADTSEATLRDKFIKDESVDNGFATVDGKKINYANIGIAGKDPLAGQGNASFIKMNDQKAEHQQFLKDNQTVDVPMFGDGGKIIGWKTEAATPQNSYQGQSIAAIAGPPTSPKYAENIKGIADVAAHRYGSDQQLAGQRYTADQALEGQKITAREAADSRKYAADQKALYDPTKIEKAKMDASSKKEERLIAGKALLMSKPEFIALPEAQQQDMLERFVMDPDTESWVLGTPGKEAVDHWRNSTPAVPAIPGRRVPRQIAGAGAVVTSAKPLSAY